MSRKIRLICQEIDCTHAVNAGGPVQTNWKTFEVELPDSVAAWLCEFEDSDRGSPRARYIEAVEMMEPTR